MCSEQCIELIIVVGVSTTRIVAVVLVRIANAVYGSLVFEQIIALRVRHAAACKILEIANYHVIHVRISTVINALNKTVANLAQYTHNVRSPRVWDCVCGSDPDTARPDP